MSCNNGKSATGETPALGQVDLRIGARLFSRAREHIEDFDRGEQAGFLLCRSSRHILGETLLAFEFHPVPEDEITERDGAYRLSWSAAFNAAMIERAALCDGSLVLVHSHGNRRPVRLSEPDLRNAGQLLPPASRLLGGATCATLVLGGRCCAGRTWSDGKPGGFFSRISVVADTIEWWPAVPTKLMPRLRDDRHARALGWERTALLRQARVAVVGCSGGGSHVCQQLAHLGIGTIIAVDDELVAEVNLGRMVGSTPADVDAELKVDVMHRLIKSIDPSIDCLQVPKKFQHPDALAALQSADVVVCCVDSFALRDQLAAFGRRHLMPMVDIGMGITTVSGILRSAFGQLIVTVPDSACARCTPLLSDAVLEREQQDRPAGYDRNPDAADPQVISMNGTLASEAANSVLDLLTAYSGGGRGPGWWGYDARKGTIVRSDLPPRWPACPACAQAAHGDPRR